MFSDALEEVSDPNQWGVRVGVAVANRDVHRAEPAERDKVRDDLRVRVECAEDGIHRHLIDLLDDLAATRGVEVGTELSADEGRGVELIEEVCLATARDVPVDAKVDEEFQLASQSVGSQLGD